MAGRGESRYRIVLDTSGFESALNAAARQMQEFGQTLVKGFIGFEVGKVAAEALAEAVKGIPEAMVQAVEHVAEVSKQLEILSERTGISTEELQRLDVAAKLGGSGIDSVAAAVNKMQKNLVDGKAAFEKLGLSIADMKKLSPDQDLRAVARAIEDLSSPAEKAAARIAIFGKAGNEMAGTLKAATSAASELGGELSGPAVEAAAALKEKTELVGIAWDRVLMQFGAAVAQSPELQHALDDIKDALIQIADQLKVSAPSIASWMDKFVVGGRLALSVLKPLVQFFTDDIRDAFSNLKKNIENVGFDEFVRERNAENAKLAFPNARDIKAGRGAGHFAGAGDEAAAKKARAEQLRLEVLAEREAGKLRVEAIKEVNAILKNEYHANVAVLKQSFAEEATAYRESTRAAKEAQLTREEVNLAVLRSEEMLTAARHHGIQSLEEQRLHIDDVTAAHISGLQKIAETRDLTDEEAAALGHAADNYVLLGEAEKKYASQMDVARKLQGIAGIIGDLKSAFGIGGALGTIMGGAQGMLGAGSNFMAGLASGDMFKMIGSAIQGAGILFQTLKSLFSKPEYMKVMEEVGSKWGVAISEGLAKQIASTETKLKVSRAMAELLNLAAIMKESGKDSGSFTTQIGDLLNAVALKAVPAKEGIAELGKVFLDLKASAEAGSIASEQAMITMIARAKELGIVIPEMAAAILASLKNVAKELVTFFAGMAFTESGGGGFTAKLRAKLQDDLKSGRITQAEYDKQKQEAQAGGTPSTWSPQQFGANATILGATFGGLSAQEGIVKAAKDLHDAFEQLLKGMPQGGAMPGELKNMAMIVDLIDNSPNFKRAAEAAEAGAQAMKGLAEAGALSQKTTEAFDQSALTLYRQAYDAAIAGGYSPEEARQAAEQANLPLLAQLQHAQEMGAKLSPQAQAILAQAQKDGTLPLKSVADQQLGVLREIRDRLPKGGLASGGYVPPTPRGSWHILGEGREGEYVIPASKMPMVTAGGGGVGGGVIHLTIPVTTHLDGNQVGNVVVDAVINAFNSNGPIVSAAKRAGGV